MKPIKTPYLERPGKNGGLFNKYIQKNISAYAYPEHADSITGYRYYSSHEITSEVLSAKKDTKFIKLIKEMWEKEGLK